MSNAKRKSTYFKLPIAKTHKKRTLIERHAEILEYLPILKQEGEVDILKRNHLFLRDSESQTKDQKGCWEERLAQKYYDQLFKEYCLSNLSRYKSGQIALRWRTREEVVNGKGQFSCGNLECESSDKLNSFEVNFGYMEQGVKKNALVKLRLCEECGYKLNYKKKHLKKQVVQEETLEDDSSVESVESVEETVTKEKEKETQQETQESSHWSQDQTSKDVELSKEEEFDQYFKDLLQ
jgi:protein FRA10AC1